MFDGRRTGIRGTGRGYFNRGWTLRRRMHRGPKRVWLTAASGIGHRLARVCTITAGIHVRARVVSARSFVLARNRDSQGEVEAPRASACGALASL